MGETLTLARPPVTIAVRRRRAARNLTLRVPHAGGAVTLTAPPGTSRAALERFVAQRRDWLLACLSDRPREVIPEPGTLLPFAGRPHRLVAAPRAPVVLEGETIRIPGADARFRARLRAWLVEEARARLSAAVDAHAARLGRAHGGIRLRDTRSRWGSCAADGRLMFSWRLVMAPPEVLDYVAAHEVAHLAEMNHSARYWQVLAGLCPDYEAPKAWLRGPEAAALHTYRF